MGGGSADKKTRKSSCAVSANNSNCRSNFGNLFQKKKKNNNKLNRKKEEHRCVLKTEKVSKTRIKKTKQKLSLQKKISYQSCIKCTFCSITQPPFTPSSSILILAGSSCPSPMEMLANKPFKIVFPNILT